MSLLSIPQQRRKVGEGARTWIIDQASCLAKGAFRSLVHRVLTLPWIDPAADARLPHLQTCKNRAQTMIHEESDWGSEISATVSPRHRRRQRSLAEATFRPRSGQTKKDLGISSKDKGLVAFSQSGTLNNARTDALFAKGKRRIRAEHDPVAAHHVCQQF